ncbi:hypothetical protein HUO09_05620 [Vibrio sp. Y2-5]|uniref:hypothetical protein n=1 Tax=Vibrio sp. Y2-5 TaxID=2743977 RepID=UPI001661338C|nr:hypothetical protein [Vibrio sp. Y2-5]MBD0785810.1 hypothetical protein [Vibrio sp. Y2-5]
MNKNRFINDVIKPWEELNLLLVKQFAFQPDLSDVTRLAGGISIALRHQVDFSELSDRQTNEMCFSQNLIVDAGDYYKHGELRNTSRNCPMVVVSNFEYKDNEFAFLRNTVLIEHYTHGSYDFMKESLKAIQFWIQQHGYEITWQSEIKFAPRCFQHEAMLKFDPKYCFEMSSTRIQFFKENNAGALEPYSPEEVRFAVY